MTLPRLAAFDMDGSLLTSKKTISPATYRALIDMHAHGVAIIFASGRIGHTMVPQARTLPFPVGMVTLNGAVVYTGLAEESPILLSGAAISTPAARIVIDYAAQNSATLNIYKDALLYAQSDQRDSRWIEYYQKMIGATYTFVESYDDLFGISPSKMLLLGECDELDRAELFFREQFGDTLSVLRTWDYFLEFMHRDVSKGSGITAFANHLGIPLSEVIAFGDADNDLPMLSVAGMSVAPSNGSPGAKGAAKWVSPLCNDEDFIAEAWESIKAGRLFAEGVGALD